MRKTIETNWIAFYLNDNHVKYFDRAGLEYIPKKIQKVLGNKNVTVIIYRIQACDSIMCG